MRLEEWNLSKPSKEKLIEVIFKEENKESNSRISR